MTYKYKTERYGTTITKVPCEKETQSCVWVPRWQMFNGPVEYERKKRVSMFDSYFDTWEAAHTHLLNKFKIELDTARVVLAKAQGAYGNVIGMKPPTEG